jgi:hypothetical protein
MNRQRFTKRIIWGALIGIGLGAAWWGLRQLDPTSSAIFISDSPNGKYRSAVFCEDAVGHPGYMGGLFNGRWPHHELSGLRVNWNNDSLGSSDFRPVWHPDGVDIDFSTGKGDERAEISGRDVGGSQQWQGP